MGVSSVTPLALPRVCRCPRTSTVSSRSRTSEVLILDPHKERASFQNWRNPAGPCQIRSVPSTHLDMSEMSCISGCKVVGRAHAPNSPRFQPSMLARTTPTFCLEIRGHLPANCAFSSVVGDGGYVVMTSPATSPTPWRRGRRGRGRDPCTLSTEASLVVCRQAPGCLHCFREVVLKSADDHVEWIGPSPIAEGRSHHVKFSLHVAICDRDTLQHGAS